MASNARIPEAQLSRLAAAVRRVASPAQHGALMRRVAARSQALVAQGFARGRDPAGKPWEPLKHRRGKPLVDTGRLKGSYTARALNQYRVEVRSPLPYARIHNEGGTVRVRRPFGRPGPPLTIRIPERRVVPKPEQLGVVWSTAFLEEFRGWASALLGRR